MHFYCVRLKALQDGHTRGLMLICSVFVFFVSFYGARFLITVSPVNEAIEEGDL